MIRREAARDTVVVFVFAVVGYLLAAGLSRLAWGAQGEPPADPSAVDQAVSLVGPVGRAALGGIACLLSAWLLSRGRARWGWLRRGWAGNAAASAYSALTAFGAILALGGSVDAGLTAVGGALVTGLGLARDPETVRLSLTAGETGAVD